MRKNVALSLLSPTMCYLCAVHAVVYVVCYNTMSLAGGQIMAYIMAHYVDMQLMT